MRRFPKQIKQLVLETRLTASIMGEELGVMTMMLHVHLDSGARSQEMAHREHPFDSHKYVVARVF